MSFQWDPSRDVGLQNVLESGLALMRGNDMPAVPRDVVLAALIDLFSKADEGSRNVSGRRLLVRSEERQALETFTVFFRYLQDEYGAELQERLSETTTVLKQMQGNSAEESKAQRAAGLIASFLEALHRDRALAPLESPNTLTYA